MAAQAPLSAQDDLLQKALPEIAKQASQFWQSAAGYVGREVLHQKALTLPAKRKIRIGVKATQPVQREFKDREIISYYALSTFHATPEALHEFRQVLAVDGKPVMPEPAALRKFQRILSSRDDRARTELQEDFAQANLTVTATDFGQLVLLFTRVNLPKYTFARDSAGFIGADRVIVIKFRQSGGNEALRIEEAGKQVREPLSGQLWVRESDYKPLRITLTAAREQEKQQIRDEARVDYALNAAGAALPVSVVFRRYVGDELRVENISQYSDWRPVSAQ